MPRSSEEMERDLEAIDRMAEELDQGGQATAAVAEPPSPPGSREELLYLRRRQQPVSVAESVQSATPVGSTEEASEKPRQPILPATGSILESLSRAMGLLIDGVQAVIVRTGVHESAEQLGPLSLVLGTLKKAKEQADQLLGKKNE